MRPQLPVFLALAAFPVLAHAQTPARGAAATANPPTARKTVAHTGLNFSPDDQKLLAGYQLNTDRLGKFEVATKKVTEAAKRDPSLKAQFDSAGTAAKGLSIDESVRRVEASSPAFVALLKEAGTTPREYFLTSFSLVTATMGSFIRKSNPDTALPNYIPAENITFVEANRSRIEGDFKSYREQAN